MPSQRGALHAHRKLGHAREHRQLAQRLRVTFRMSGDQAVKLFEDLLRFLFALPFTLCVIMEAEAFEIAQPAP